MLLHELHKVNKIKEENDVMNSFVKTSGIVKNVGQSSSLELNKSKMKDREDARENTNEAIVANKYDKNCQLTC